VLSNQGKYEEAEEMHRQALGLSETVLGKKHPSTLGSTLTSVYYPPGFWTIGATVACFLIIGSKGKMFGELADPSLRRRLVSIARTRQVCTELMEATVLSVYLPEEKRTSIYGRSSFLATLPPGACPAEPFSYLCVAKSLSYLFIAEPLRTGE
jgi:hypothetical protein